ncbi:MAG: hypothetical protein PHH00_02830 [Candidatus Nanoarchaeia archaeon]|nr:hypothetical protein [Candidatus Nanoarchaeia archaeon]
MNEGVNKDIALKKVENYLREVDELSKKSYKEGNDEKEQLYTKIKGFVQGTFKDDDKKLEGLRKARPLSAMFFGRIETEKEEQEKYLLHLRGIKNNLLAFKEELELIDSSEVSIKNFQEEKINTGVNIHAKKVVFNSSAQLGGKGNIQQVDMKKEEEYKSKGRIAGIISVIICAIFAILVINFGWDLTGQILTAFSALFGILGVGSLIKPESIGQVTSQILHNISQNINKR